MAEPFAGVVRPAGPQRLRDSMALLLGRHTVAAVAGIICLAIGLVTLLAPLLVPYDPLAADPAHLLQPPTLTHPFGTDQLGRDLFSRTLLGGRPTLFASLAAVAIASLVGGGIGMIAGYAGGLVDLFLMRLMDVLLSFPFVLLALVLVAALGSGLANLTVAVACTQIPVFARLARALALSIVGLPYVEAAVAAGAGHRRIIWRHILPNALGPLVVQAATTTGLAVGLVSAFNFLGLGIQPPTPDWGDMVNDGKLYIYTEPYLVLVPGVAISITVIAVCFFADGLRDLLDPAHR